MNIEDLMPPISERIESYLGSKNINNSLLSLCLDPKWLEYRLKNREVEDDEKSFLRVGSGIDTLLTNPDDFKKEFFVWTHARPAGLMALFIEALPLNLMWMDVEEQEIAYQEAYIKSRYKKSKQSVIDAFKNEPKYQAYYNARILSDGKKILSEEDIQHIENAVEGIYKSPIALSYFAGHNKNPNIEIIHQFPLYFEYLGLQCKGLLDGLKINHLEKTIEPFDLKSTIKDAMDFETSYYQFGYFRQFQFYKIGLYYELNTNPLYESIKDYTVLPFSAIVTSKKTDAAAIRFIINAEHGKEDFIHNGKTMIGLDTLIKGYQYHISTGDFNAPYFLIQKQFTMEI